MSNREIVGIQYLRGIAACAVVVDHTFGMASFPKYFGTVFMDHALSKGAIGVNLFFMISGLIMVIISLSPDLTPKTDRSSFIQRRLTRIVPLMWIAIASYAALRYLGRGNQFDPLPYLRAATLWPVGEYAPLNIWTLKYEFIFYAIICISLLGRQRWWPLLGLWLISPFAYAGYAALHPTTSATTTGLELARTLASPLNLQFGAGALLGVAWLKYVKAFSLDWPATYTTFIVYFALCVAAAVFFDLKVDDLRGVLIEIAMFSPLLLLACISAEKSNRLGMLLGNASFSIYLFHPHIVSALLGIWKAIIPNPGIIIVGSTVAILATLGGVIIHLLVEKPLISWLSRFTTAPARPIKQASA